MISLAGFVAEWTGRGVNLPEDKNPYGFQCVELVNEWLKELGLHTEPFTNAQDFDDKMALYEGTTCVFIKNTPTNVPLPGDIVIWQGPGLPNGHIAIFVHGDMNQFTSFDQNWPLGSLPHLQWHNYVNVEGWIHPKILDPVPVPPTTIPPPVVGVPPQPPLVLPDVPVPVFPPATTGTPPPSIPWWQWIIDLLRKIFGGGT